MSNKHLRFFGRSPPSITIYKISIGPETSHSAIWKGHWDFNSRLRYLRGNLVVTRGPLQSTITNYETGVIVSLERDISVLLASSGSSPSNGSIEFCGEYILVAQHWGIDIFELPLALISTEVGTKDSHQNGIPIRAHLLATVPRSAQSHWTAVSFFPYINGSARFGSDPETAHPCQISILIRAKHPDASAASEPRKQFLHHVILTISPELLTYGRRLPTPNGPIAHIGSEAQSHGLVRTVEIQTRVLGGGHSSAEINLSSTSGRGFWLENVKMRFDIPLVENVVFFSTSQILDGALEGEDISESFASMMPHFRPVIDIGSVDTSRAPLAWSYVKPFASLDNQEPQHTGKDLPIVQQRQGTVRYVDNWPLCGARMCSFDDATGRIAITMVTGKIRVADFGAVSHRA
ncbi:hypothetical protein DL93DRAFT_815362 [Clavulina sp. PMI_390]|nr:hypothetical protein DL93DRAFT_815362 [Clavulina sp. PMI_390]